MTQPIARRAFISILASACAGAALFATGCASTYPSYEEAVDSATVKPQVGTTATIEAGVLSIGINTSNAPYSWPVSSADDGSIQGIDVDAALAMADAMGLTVKFVSVGTNYSAAAEGLCDVVMGATAALVPTSEVLVGNYLEAAPALFGRAGSGVPTVQSLDYASVAVQESSPSARALAALVPTVQLTGFSTINDAFDALEAGSVQYVACESIMGGYLCADISNVTLVGALSLPEMRGVAVAAGNTELQNAVSAALDQITSNGVLGVIRKRWVGSLPYITTSNQVVSAATEEPAAEGEYVAEDEAPVEG